MKLQVPFVQLPLQFDADLLRRELAALDGSRWREHPQKFPGNFALPLISVDGDPDSDAVSGVMRPTPYLAECPYLMQVLLTLGGVWGRTRLMKLSGQAEVSPHADINYYWRERVRVHVPILTQPSVRFLCGDAEVNMAPGECWIFDTWRSHRVINAADEERVHLVADTVGSARFWDLVGKGRAPGAGDFSGWTAHPVSFDSGSGPPLRFESVNVPTVMTPWEMREHFGFLLRDIIPHPQLGIVHQMITQLQTVWQSLWAEHGDDVSAWPLYRRELDAFESAMAQAALPLRLVNGADFLSTLRAMLLRVALADHEVAAAADEPRVPASAGAK
ncbi:aspartyl/asparaginyl beta-hydroxylase domain-containing protein [Rhodanobacter sp. BL-MT-08]